MNPSAEQSFLSAYEEHSDAIFRFVFFKLNNRERALDLTQETFMKTWMQVKKDGGVDNIKSFLYKVAGNLVIDEYRSRGRKDHMTSSMDEMNESGFEPHGDTDEVESLINQLDGEKVMAEVHNLPDTYSSIIFMKYAEELSVTEIAENTGLTPNLVSVRLNRGLKKLRELVDSKNTTSN